MRKVEGYIATSDNLRKAEENKNDEFYTQIEDTAMAILNLRRWPAITSNLGVKAARLRVRTFKCCVSFANIKISAYDVVYKPWDNLTYKDFDLEKWSIQVEE